MNFYPVSGMGRISFRGIVFSSLIFVLLQGFCSANCAEPVRVFFMGFDAHKVNDKAMLKWEVSYEKDAKGYYIERSTDGINWVTVRFEPIKPGSGFKYSLTDNDPSSGLNYYRVRAEDVDGNSDYSITRSVEFSNLAFEVKLFPVPANDKLQLRLSNANENSFTIKIYDNTGRLVMNTGAELETGNDLLDLDISKLGRGIYVLGISGQQSHYSGKFIIQ